MHTWTVTHWLCFQSHYYYLWFCHCTVKYNKIYSFKPDTKCVYVCMSTAHGDVNVFMKLEVRGASQNNYNIMEKCFNFDSLQLMKIKKTVSHNIRILHKTK